MAQQHDRVSQWRNMNGQHFLTPNAYEDINENSLVMDLGFYRGEFSKKFSCKVLAYEGSPSIYNEYGGNAQSNTILKPYGLSSSDKTVLISKNRDSSSAFNVNKNNAEDMKLVDVVQEFTDESIEKVDFMKINIEGGEYELLDRMIESGIITKVNRMMIQFHKEHEREITRDMITKRLEETHNRYINVDYVWEGWKLKS